MANITIKDLTQQTTNDSENFGRDLSEDELTLTGGGFWDWLRGGGWGGAGGKA
jgi:hypothetical protein